jgi:hypothetical protein
MDEQRLAEIEAEHTNEGGFCSACGSDHNPPPFPCETMELAAEVRRLWDVERPKERAQIDDVIAHPERYPEIVARARKLMGESPLTRYHEFAERGAFDG